MKKNKFVIFLLSMFFTVCLFATVVFAQDLTVFDVKYETNSKSLVISASKEIKAEMFKLDEPARTIIDLPGAIFYQVAKKIDVNNDLIKQVRISQFQADPPITRVTIETPKHVDFHINNILEKDIQNIKLSSPNASKKEAKESTITINKDTISKYKNEEKLETQTVNLNTDKNLLDIDFKETNDETKVYIAAKDNITYKYFTLDNPDRLVVDAYGISLNEVSNPFLIKNSNIVQKFRTGLIEKTENSPEGTRLVFELKTKISVIDNKKSDKSLILALTADKNNLSSASITNTQTISQIISNSSYTPKYKPSGKYLVVVDPGHGGNDPGAVGPSGTREKDINLAVSYFLRKILMENGVSVIMARGDDSEIELQPRVDIANNNNADLFVSIHCNALDGNSPMGVETYYRTPQSADFAKSIHKNMVQTLGTPDRRVRGDRNLFVIRKTSMPSVLVEIGYISNRTEEANLANSAHQKKVAQALYKGIKEYLGKYIQVRR